MKFCSKCKLSVSGQGKYCPLCQGTLQDLDTNDNEIFPVIPTIFHKYNLFFRILILVSVIVTAISVIVDMMLTNRIWWSFFVVAGIGCFWLSMAIAISKRRNIPKNILYQVVDISALAVIWDLCTGWHAWSIDYIIPTACTLAMLSMAIIAKVTNLRVKDYIIYLVIDALFGIIPIVFILTGILSERFPSMICVAASIISLVALILFEGENMREEFKRRLHL